MIQHIAAWLAGQAAAVWVGVLTQLDGDVGGAQAEVGAVVGGALARLDLDCLEVGPGMLPGPVRGRRRVGLLWGRASRG